MRVVQNGKVLGHREGAKPNSSVIWQTHSSPLRRTSRIRTRFGSDSALVMAMNSFIEIVRQKTKWKSHDSMVPASIFVNRAGSEPAEGTGEINQRVSHRAGGGQRQHPGPENAFDNLELERVETFGTADTHDGSGDGVCGGNRHAEMRRREQDARAGGFRREAVTDGASPFYGQVS